MKSFDSLMISRIGPIIAGVAVGILAPLLVLLGNPGNMGICVACFERDIAGALGFHRAAIVPRPPSVSSWASSPPSAP